MCALAQVYLGNRPGPVSPRGVDEHGQLDAVPYRNGERLKQRPAGRPLPGQRLYDARKLRNWLAERGSEAVIPPNPTRKNPHSYDPVAYRNRNAIERMFCRLKDWRRLATRYDKLASSFAAAVAIAAIIIWWT